MNVRRPLSLIIVLAAAATAVAVDAPPYYPQPEQSGYQDCVTHCCKLAPETKQIKKTVYEVQEVPYCLKKLPPLLSLFHHHHCEDCAMCAECQCPRYRKVLAKKEIVCKEICTSKCVVEEHVERVPCQVCAPGCSQ